MLLQVFLQVAASLNVFSGRTTRVKSRGTNSEGNVEVTKTYLSSRSSVVAAYIERPAIFNLLQKNERLEMLGLPSFCSFGKLKNGEPILFRTFRSHLTKMHRKQSSLWL